MFFRLPVVRFFNRVINRAMVTVALVLLQIGWLLWAFFSLTAGKVWVNAGLSVLSLFITLYLVRKDENSDYKIIWLVLIGMMPLLGGALYLAFGNKAPAKRMRQRMQAVERQHTIRALTLEAQQLEYAMNQTGSSSSSSSSSAPARCGMG